MLKFVKGVIFMKIYTLFYTFKNGDSSLRLYPTKEEMLASAAILIARTDIIKISWNLLEGRGSNADIVDAGVIRDLSIIDESEAEESKSVDSKNVMLLSLVSDSGRAVATADSSHIDIIAEFFIDFSSGVEPAALEFFDDFVEKNWKYSFFHYRAYLNSSSSTFYIDEDELIEFCYSSIFHDLVSKGLVHFVPDASVSCNFLDIGFERYGYDPFHPDVVQEALDLVDDVPF